METTYTECRNKAIGVKRLLYTVVGKNSILQFDNELLIYKTFILPILTYGAATWGLVAETHFHKLQIVQNKTLRTCLNAP